MVNKLGALDIRACPKYSIKVTPRELLKGSMITPREFQERLIALSKDFSGTLPLLLAYTEAYNKANG